MSGECKSKFLSNLAGFNASNRNLVDGIEVNNVNASYYGKASSH